MIEHGTFNHEKLKLLITCNNSKQMKRVIFINLAFCSLIIAFASCKKDIRNFLDKPPGVDVTEDTIFSSKSQVDTFIAGMYLDGVATGYPNWLQGEGGGDNNGIWASACDESSAMMTWTWTKNWNFANITPTSNQDFRWIPRWKAIRRANIILEIIYGVPGVDQNYKNQVKGEANFVRALNYFDMLKFYGGVPIVDHRFLLSEDLKIPRSSVEQVVKFIVEGCDKAALFCPDFYPPELRGRITKGAALLLKAKTLLYAASPIFNTNTPYLDLGENNKLICYGNYDLNRWQLAADAAKAVIDWAPAGNIRLIEDQGITKNYKYVWEKLDNDEIILAEKSREPVWPWYFPWYGLLPTAGPYPGFAGATITMNFVKSYEKANGEPQVWDMENGGNDLNIKYAELDPRFAQSIAYNGVYWNVDIPIVETFVGGSLAKDCAGGAWLRKFIPDGLTKTTPQIPSWTLFRLAEAYLDYAEALNEAQGPSQQVYDAVNIIRHRSGMPDLPNGLSQPELRERIRHERAIELAFEDHRFWDIRRWLIAENEGVMNGNMWGIIITKIAGTNPQEFSYKPYVFEVRTFLRKMYLHPFPQGEVNKGYLIQNPGY